MSDALTAILSIPPAIDACKNLITALRKKLAHDEHKAQTDVVLDKVIVIETSILSFTSFTEDLRKWKAVHYVTQLLLYNDLPDTLSILKIDQQDHLESVSRNLNKIRREFNQLLNGRFGTMLYIDTLNHDDFVVIGIPEHLFDTKNQTWGGHLKELSQTALKQIESKDIGSFFLTLQKLERSCTVLNVMADTKLKDGIDKITTVMADLRAKTKAAP